MALISAASKARDGLQCTVPALTHNSDGKLDLELIQRQTGGQNCHIDIEFEDGIVWLARIRMMNDPLLPPQPTQMYIFASEVATLKFLEKTAIPAPKVYAYADESDANLVGASYMLIEKLSGSPLQWNKASSGQRSKVMGQLADIFLELEKYPLPLSGSLCLGHHGATVSGFA